MTDIWPAVNVALSVLTALISALVGMIVKGLIQELRDMKSAAAKTSEALGGLQNVVSGNYITRTESVTSRNDLAAEWRERYDKLETRLREVEQRK
jgi:hypothetical protein